MVRFPVAPVKPADEPMATTDVAERWRGHGVLAVEASSRPGSPLAATRHGHGLLMAIHHAFAEHRPLVIAPDHVWTCIAQGMARWVEHHAERLRPRLVRHHGRIPLEVRRDDFVAGGDNDWPAAITALVAEVRRHLGGRADLFVGDFSTTDTDARAASHVALMAGMQRYFTYTVSSLCGIPDITLEGTPEDWRSIRDRVAVLGELDLDHWGARLDPVLARLEATARGEVDTAWWRDLYKLESASGGEVVTGWINVLFPFRGDSGVEPSGAVFQDDWEFAFEPKLSSFPGGLAQVPFTWNYHGDRRPMSLVAGFVGVAQLDGGALRPQLGWAVAAEQAARTFQVFGDPTTGVPTLAPRDPRGLRSLAGLAAEVAGLGEFALRLSWCDQLDSLAGLEGLTGLVDLSVSDCPVTTLAPIAGLPALRRLFVTQCPRLHDVRAMAELPALRDLTLQRCPIDELATLASLDRLHSLSLFLDTLPRSVCAYHHTPEMVRAAMARLRALAAG